MPNSSMLTTVIVIIVAMKQVHSYTESCIGEFCFTTPDSNELKNFDGAKSWCTDKNSALAVVNGRDAQLALTQFLTSSNTNAMMFINIKLYQLTQEANTWFLVNGARYNGNIGFQGNYEYKLYCCLKLYGDHFQVDASKPYEINRYICEFQDTRCLNNSTNNILYNGRCYVKYENETLTWYQARERCINNGGDLATFQNDPSLNRYISPFNTSWLNPSLTYWVGIRWNDWSWKSPDGGNEAIYTSWSSQKPSTYYYQCVCVDPNGIPVWSWTDCNCGETRQFVCLKTVPTTTTSTTTTTTTTTTTARTLTVITPSEVTAGLNTNAPTNGSEVEDASCASRATGLNYSGTIHSLAIGLGVGLAGGFFVLLSLVVLAVVAVKLMRNRRKNAKSNERVTTTAKTPQADLDRSRPTAKVDSADPEAPYQHLQRETTVGPGNSMPLYEQLNHPENLDYELIPQNK